jgi:hypothetical protein
VCATTTAAAAAATTTTITTTTTAAAATSTMATAACAPRDLQLHRQIPTPIADSKTVVEEEWHSPH